MAGGSKGRRSAKKAEKAPKGGGAELPEGVEILAGPRGEFYKFTEGGKTVEFKVMAQFGAGKNADGEAYFTVGGSFEKTKQLEGRDATRSALKILRIMRYDAATRPDGYIYQNKPYTKDGFGKDRARIYEKVGFSARNSSGRQYAIVKDGKLQPYTPPPRAKRPSTPAPATRPTPTPRPRYSELDALF